MGKKIAIVAAAAGLLVIGGTIGAGYAALLGVSKLAGAALGASFFVGYPLSASQNNHSDYD